MATERTYELDPYWTEKGKSVIHKSISIFDKFQIQSESSSDMTFLVDGAVFGEELEPYKFYCTPWNSKAESDTHFEWNIQCCPREIGAYVFGFTLSTDKDGKRTAYVYHNGHGVRDYGLEIQ